MINYDVETGGTDPRLPIYFGLAFASIASAPLLASEVSTLLPTPLAQYGLGKALSPFVIFGILLWLFDRGVWHWPFIRKLSRIPYLGGTWEGELSRSALDPMQPPQTGTVNCYIRQTWRHIDFVFEGLPIIVRAAYGGRRTRPIHSTIGSTLTVGLFVKNATTSMSGIPIRLVPGTS
jgi:SMODS-associating 2TM, beta-strand rich effector domain